MRGKPEIADYILVYKNQKIGVIEAKAEDLPATEGVAQAKAYAGKLHIDYAYSTNGKEIYSISMKTGKEEAIDAFPTPDELWHKTFSNWNDWKEKFASVPNEGDYGKRYYQEIAINNILNAVAEEKTRILLTMATGTGKTAVAFQVAWKLFQTRWNLKRDGSRRPRILFLTDRNILADQAFNAFSAFDQDALVRINPLDICKRAECRWAAVFILQSFKLLWVGRTEPHILAITQLTFLILLLLTSVIVVELMTKVTGVVF